MERRKGTVTPLIRPVPFILADPQRSVPAGIRPDHPEFIPLTDPDGGAGVLAKHAIALHAGASDYVDCGFELTVPPGYEVVVHPYPRWSYLNMLYRPDGDRFRLLVTNLGQAPVAIAEKDVLANLTVRAVWPLDFVLENI